MLCHVIVRTAYPFPWGCEVLLLEPAHRRALTSEQCGVQYLAQGHFDMQFSPARSWDLNQSLVDLLYPLSYSRPADNQLTVIPRWFLRLIVRLE